jgi:[ribosomal protein S18]-alanine N-acetyltransferase
VVASTISIERFERRHLKRVVAIERASFGRDAWPSQAFLDYWRESPDLFLIARIGRRIAGYSIASLYWRGAEIDSIAVHPRYRSRGVAQALLNATMADLRGITLRLMVDTSNAAAVQLYRRYGFVRTRLVKDYYGPGRNAWRMRLDLRAKTTIP